MKSGSPNAPGWTRHFVHRSQRVTTTWKLRLGCAVLVAGAVWATSAWWTVAFARSLVCDRHVAVSDAILLENFDPDYVLFERATALRHSGIAPRVLVPVRTDGDGQPNAVALGIARVMAQIAHLDDMQVVPIREVEPISLNAGRQIRQFLQREHIRSVVVVSPYFRSRRSALVYRATLGPAGISVGCDHVQGTSSVDTWTDSLHGIQGVVEQWLKLQYYQLYVLPFHADV